MIIFVPAYDISTQSNLNIASSINFNNSITLFGQEATREKLLEILAKSDTPLFAMSHGNPDILYAQNGEIALASILLG